MKKIIISMVSSNVCTSTVTTYQSDEAGFKVIKRAEYDYADYPIKIKCIEKT